MSVELWCFRTLSIFTLLNTIIADYMFSNVAVWQASAHVRAIIFVEISLGLLRKPRLVVVASTIFSRA